MVGAAGCRLGRGVEVNRGVAKTKKYMSINYDLYRYELDMMKCIISQVLETFNNIISVI